MHLSVRETNRLCNYFITVKSDEKFTNNVFILDNQLLVNVAD